MKPTNETTVASPRPWWREAYLWLVVAGPAIVVVAGVVTTFIAFDGADRVIRVPQARAVAQAPAAISTSMQPALVVRNTAAIPTSLIDEAPKTVR